MINCNQNETDNKNRSYKQDINRPRRGHKHRYTKFICLFIYLHFIYSWQSLIIYYNRLVAFTIVFCKAN